MGRHKIKKTRKQLLDQQKRYRERHNATRRDRYANDKDYRESVHRRNRDRYRTENEVSVRKAVSSEQVRLAAKPCKLSTMPNSKPVLCVDYEAMAGLLGGYHIFVLHRWHRSGRFPRAKHEAIVGGHRKSVYLLDEAKRLVSVIRSHQEQKLYFTAKDTETIERLNKSLN